MERVGCEEDGGRVENGMAGHIYKDCKELAVVES